MKKLQRRKDTQTLIDRGIAFLTTFGRGDFVSWASYDTAIGCHHLSTEGRLVWSAVVKAMRDDHKIVLHVKPGEGFELLTHARAAIVVPSRRSRRAARQLYRGIKEASTVNLGGLQSDAQRLALVRSIEAMRTERNAANATAREAEKPHAEETLPVRPTQ